jgi:hypothetical protein
LVLRYLKRSLKTQTYATRLVTPEVGFGVGRRRRHGRGCGWWCGLHLLAWCFRACQESSEACLRLVHFGPSVGNWQTGSATPALRAQPLAPISSTCPHREHHPLHHLLHRESTTRRPTSDLQSLSVDDRSSGVYTRCSRSSATLPPHC